MESDLQGLKEHRVADNVEEVEIPSSEVIGTRWIFEVEQG